MADVDLSVEVRALGIQAAIQQVNTLRQAGLDTGMALQMLQRDFDRGLAAIQKFSTAQRGTTNVMRNEAEAVQALTNNLHTQEAAYQRIATLSPKLSAIQRLTEFGGGNLQAGIRAASNMQAYRDALGADATRDLLTVQRQLAAVEDARATRLAATANLQRANWEAGLQGMTRQQAAQERLNRATAEYAQAQAALRAAPRVTAAAQRNPEEEARRLRAQAAAIDAVTAARTRLTAAENEVAAANEARLQQSYGYFILAGLLAQVTQGVIAFGQASLSASMNVERGFADVDRTFDGTSRELESLRVRLTELSTETPISVIDLQEIATLGNQLGIAAADIESFTQVIAQYTAVSGESAETAATAFGRISNLTGLAASQYGNLASAITYVARTTVATESTIQNTAKEISALAAGAGFSAQSIVGLAGALSSLAIPPERARGALSLYFGALNSAVAEGGPKLEAFASLTNMTADQLNRLVRENRGQEVFTAFIQGLSQLDTVAKTTALDTLGLSTIRVDQTMRALAQNVPLVTQAFDGANRAFEQGTEIGDQYAKIQETLNSKWIEFQNASMNAAAAIGDSFAPAAKAALEALTGLLIVAQQFASSPIGRAFITVAGTAAIFIGTLAAAGGVFALARASLVVLSFSLSQLGWTSASKGLIGWIASLVSADKATRAAAMSQTGLRVALAETTAGLAATTVGARVASFALNALKVALPILAITAAITLVDQFAQKIEGLVNPSSRLTDDLTDLKNALLADNPSLLADDVAGLVPSFDAAGRPISNFNQSILAAIAVQKQAEGALNNTNDALDMQRIKFGDASREWLEGVLKDQEDIRDILDGKGWWESFTELGQVGGGDALVSRDDLESLLLGGLDISEISQIAINDGRDAAYAAYAAWARGASEANPELDVAIGAFGINVLPNILDSVIDSYEKAAVEAAVSGGAIAESAVQAVGAAADFDTLGNYIGDTAGLAEGAQVTFSGLTGRLSDFRDAIQGAIQGTVGFDSVLDRAKDAAQALADAQKLDNPAPVTIGQFGEALTASIADATKFYSDISALAESGNASFALQLAELGPEAQGILSQALALDPSSQAALEANARYAAFLASDAFKNALQAEMSDSNEAYARIFQATGNLSDVQDYIAAQVAGTGAEWERQWAIDHPDLPLNVTPELVNPTEEAIELWRLELEGKLVITPRILDSGSGRPGQAVNTYTNTEDGSSITLPADLDEATLQASLDKFLNGLTRDTAPEVPATLDTSTFSKDMEMWLRSNGPFAVPVTIQPSNKSNFFLPGGITRGSQQGRYVDERFIRGGVPAFASGGLVRGPGTNTSDDIWARVSMGERIFAADRERFWGHDFMESLDRKMIPAQFMGMLQAAAVSGNRGPTTNVNVNLINPTSRDPLKQLREKSEMVAAGLWGNGEDS